MALKSIKSERRRLADEVYDQLLRAILNNEIGTDDRLVQERLASEMEISRTPVREALLRLEQEGVLVSSPRGGFVVHRLDAAEINEIYEARIAVEGHAARLLAGAATATALAGLRDTITREETIKRPSARAYFNANRKIHRRFVELAGNRYLLDMFDNIWNRGVAFQLFAAIERIDLAKSLGDHGTLVDAIAAADPDAAFTAVADHIEDGFTLQMDALAER